MTSSVPTVTSSTLAMTSSVTTVTSPAVTTEGPRLNKTADCSFEIDLCEYVLVPRSYSFFSWQRADNFSTVSVMPEFGT